MLIITKAVLRCLSGTVAVISDFRFVFLTSIIMADGVDAQPSSPQMPSGELPELRTGLVKT